MKGVLNHWEKIYTGEHESFKDCVPKTLENLKPNEGMHVIKDFEPFPMYKMMEAKGLDKHVEKISNNEYHAYFFPPNDLGNLEMNKHLEVDNSKIKKMVDIKLDFLDNKITLEEAKKECLKLLIRLQHKNLQ